MRFFYCENQLFLNTYLTNGQSALLCMELYLEEDSEKKWSSYPGRSFCPHCTCHSWIFVLNLLLIADWFSEPWHLVSHSLMAEQFQLHFKLHLIELGQFLYIAGISSKSNIWTCDIVFCPISHLHRRWEISFLCLCMYAFLETSIGKTELFLKIALKHCLRKDGCLWIML